MLIIQKFGGSSLAGIERLRRSAGICIDAAQRGHDVVAVVSAMGDTTDSLIELAQKISPHPSARELDALTTTGEQQSAALMAIMIESCGMKARSLTGWQAGLMTDSRHGGADVALLIPERIEDTLSDGIIPVITGFQGFSRAGDITSLGRGGSDTTAVAVAAALEADRCEIYTDVDGIYTADPRVIKNARKLDCIDFRDMLALSRNGSQVLHPKSVEIAMSNNVTVHLLSSFETKAGSAVCFIPDSARPDYAGVTCSRSSGEVTLAGKRAGAEALSAIALMLAGEGIGISGGSLGPDSVSIRVDKDLTLRAMQLIHDRML